jgi:hypothetical protein
VEYRGNRAIDRYVDRHIMVDQSERRMVEEMADVLLPPRNEVVETDHLQTVGKQTFAEVTTEEAGTSGHGDASHQIPPSHPVRYRTGAVKKKCR